MPRIVFANRFYWPDESASSQMLTDLAVDLARRGYEVHVVASRLRHDDPAARLASDERFDGVQIHRVATTGFGRSTLAGRALDYLGFYVTASWRLLRVIRKDDLVVAKTDPPLLSVPVSRVTALRGGHLVNWLQDVYPETATAMGLLKESATGYRALRALRDSSLRHAALNVVIGESMAARLRSRGLPAEKIRVIPNWADGRAITPLPHADNPLRRQWFDTKDFVVAYSGNMGRAHDLLPVLDAAALIQETARQSPASPAARVRFLFIGAGHQKETLARVAAERHLDNIVLHPFQPRDKLSQSLGAGDLHLVSLRPTLEGLVIPSKFYGILAAGRPVLFLGSDGGEVAHWVRQGRCGKVVAPGDAGAIADALLGYAAAPEEVRASGAGARHLLDERFDMPRATALWADALEKLTRREDAIS